MHNLISQDLYAIVILLIEKYLTSQFGVSQSQLRFYQTEGSDSKKGSFQIKFQTNWLTCRIVCKFEILMSSRIFLGSDASKANMSYVSAERRSYISWLSVGYKSQNIIFLLPQSKLKGIIGYVGQAQFETAPGNYSMQNVMQNINNHKCLTLSYSYHHKCKVKRE